MQVLLDIQDKQAVSFIDWAKTLDYVNVIKEIQDQRKSQLIATWLEAFDDIALYEQGQQPLKTAQELISELQSSSD